MRGREAAPEQHRLHALAFEHALGDLARVEIVAEPRRRDPDEVLEIR